MKEDWNIEVLEGRFRLDLKNIPKGLYRIVVTKDDSETYYDLTNTERDLFPFNCGAGTYTVTLCRKIGNNQFKKISKRSCVVGETCAAAAFLNPNIYVWYSGRIEVESIWGFIQHNIGYDYSRADKIDELPQSVEETAHKRLGISTDIAAVACCMYRTRGIPAKLVYGYADSTYHAWVSYYKDNKWWRFDPTALLLNVRVRNYEPERCY